LDLSWLAIPALRLQYSLHLRHQYFENEKKKNRGKALVLEKRNIILLSPSVEALDVDESHFESLVHENITGSYSQNLVKSCQLFPALHQSSRGRVLVPNFRLEPPLHEFSFCSGCLNQTFTRVHRQSVMRVAHHIQHFHEIFQNTWKYNKIKVNKGTSILKINSSFQCCSSKTACL